MLQDVPQSVQRGILSVLNLSEGELYDFSFSGGGCINHGGKLTTAIGDIFLKWNDVLKFPSMFEAEAKGLNLLKKANAVRVPDLIRTRAKWRLSISLARIR